MGVHAQDQNKGSVTCEKDHSLSAAIAGRYISAPMRPWKSRSKSQSRIAVESRCNWTKEGQFRWRNSNGQLVVLRGTSMLKVSEVERLALQKLALSRLQEMNLGCPLEIPKSENFPVQQQVKKRTMLLRKKAVTTNFFENKEKDKNSNNYSAVFGVPLTQCISADRLKLANDNTRMQKQQKDHCEEVLSALRIPSRESSPTNYQLISASVTQQIVVTRGSLCDVFPGELRVPFVVQSCIRFLEEKGMQTLGIFRVSGSQKRVRQLREDLDKNRTSSFDDSTQPHDVAQLLKEYFRDLPEPLLTRALYRAYLATQRTSNPEQKLRATRWLLYLLPVAHRDTLFTLLAFLHKVSTFAEGFQRRDGTWAPGNKMDSNNLATVFGPNLLRMSRGSADSPYAVHSIERAQERSDIILTVRTLIDHYDELFQVPPEDLDALYQQLMTDDPDLLNAMLTRRYEYERTERSTEGSSSSSNLLHLRNLNLEDSFTVDARQSASTDNKKFTEKEDEQKFDWNVKSGIRPLIMVKEAEKCAGKSRSQSREKMVDDRRASAGSTKDQPYSVTASFTITMTSKDARGVAGIHPQSNNGLNAGNQEPSRPKSRRVPYGKLRHMTTPAYYTEETITNVTIPSPRILSGVRELSDNYRSLMYQGLGVWDKNKESLETSKSRMLIERQPRTRTKVGDQVSRAIQPPTTERWKRQEIIASEHIQI